jgi:hypothetical protein
MENFKHIKRFNESEENLNISDVSVRSNNIYEFEHLIYYKKEYDDFIMDGNFDKLTKYTLSELDNFDIKTEYNSWSNLDKLPKFIILKCNYNEKLLEVKFQTKYDFFDGNYHMFIDKLISIKPI